MNIPHSSHLTSFLGLALLLGIASAAGAESASLVADLATGSATRGSGAGPMIVVEQPALGRQLVFYSADDGRHGTELWVTVVDGDSRTTRLAADLCPGPCSSNPTGLTAVGDRLFFFADEGLYDRALFTSGGEDTNTVRVRALTETDYYWPFSSGTYASYAGHFFFVASSPAGGCQVVWASDGSPEGTHPIEQPCPRAGPVRTLTSTAAGLFYQSFEGIHRVEFDPGELDGFAVEVFGGHFDEAVELDGAAIFMTNSPAALLRSEGESVEIVHTFGESEVITELQRLGNRVIFRKHSFFEAAPSFYESDGTPAGTKPSPALAFATGFLIQKRSADDPVAILWDHLASKVHGATLDAHAVLLNGVDRPPTTLPNTAIGTGTAFALNGQLYHVDSGLQLRTVAHYLHVDASSTTLPGTDGDTFYRFDPSILDGHGLEPRFAPRGYQTPSLVANIARDDIRSSDPRPTVTAPGYLALLGNGSLAAVDAHATSATIVDDGPYDWLAAADKRLFLTSRDHLVRLQASTGGAATDLGFGLVAPPEINRPATFGGGLYFTTQFAGQDVNFSDGTPAGSYLLYDAEPGWYPPCNITCPPEALRSYPLAIFADPQRVFWDRYPEGAVGLLTARQGEPGFEAVAEASQAPELRFEHQGKAYFTAGYTAPELWYSDGLDGGTRRLAVFEADTLPPKLFAAHQGKVFFVVNGQHGQELWRTDGTPTGTARFFDFGQGAAFGEMALASQVLFLAVATPAFGAELWAIADGAPYLVRDIYPGSRSSFPNQFHRWARDLLIFVADDGVHGAEAWITDGTAAHTRLLADIGPGASGPQHFAERNERLVFAADDGENGRELWTLVPSPLPACPPGKLCLLDDRFEVDVAYRSPTGVAGAAQRVLASRESGVFSFFDPRNWELQVKVLPACDLNNRFWVFAAATTNVEYTLTVRDRANGATRVYHNPQGVLSPAVADTDAFATCALAPPEARYQAGSGAEPAAALCSGDPEAFCFGDYKVSVVWETPAGQTGVAKPVARGSAESGLLTFFSDDNWEMMVKLLDGCAINDHRWLFAAGSTNVGWTLTLEHRTNPAIPAKTYQNPVGRLSPAIADVVAASCQD